VLTFAIALARVGLGAVLLAPNSLCIFFCGVQDLWFLGRFGDFDAEGFFPGVCTCLLMT